MVKWKLVVLGIVFVLKSHAASPPLTVLAASSLTDVLPKVAEAWKARGGDAVRFSYEGSSRLAMQIEEGVPADVFFSADQEWMDYVVKAKKVDPATRKNIIGNDLVLIAPATSSVPAHLEDLKRSEVKKIALAGENVPISRYAKTAFQKLGIWDTIQPKIVRGANVRVALQWVAAGNAQAGAVYRTDAIANKNVRIAYAFPPSTYPKIIYPAAVVASSPSAKRAKAFVDFCGTEEAQKIFWKNGFIPLTGIAE